MAMEKWCKETVKKGVGSDKEYFFSLFLTFSNAMAFSNMYLYFPKLGN